MLVQDTDITRGMKTIPIKCFKHQAMFANVHNFHIHHLTPLHVKLCIPANCRPGLFHERAW